MGGTVPTNDKLGCSMNDARRESAGYLPGDLVEFEGQHYRVVRVSKGTDRLAYGGPATYTYLDIDAPDARPCGWDEFDVRAARVTMVQPRSEEVHALQEFLTELNRWDKWPQWWKDQELEREIEADKRRCAEMGLRWRAL